MTWTPRRKDAALLVALLFIAVLRSLVWISAYPILKIADETSHFDNIQYRAEHKLHRPLQGPNPINKVLGHTASTELRRAWAATNFYFRDSFVRGRRVVPEEKELQDRARERQDAVTDGQNAAIGYPGLYYTLGVVPYRMFRASSVLARLYAVRVYSMIWGLALVACTFLAVRWTVDSRPLAFTAGLFATLHPMAAQQMIAINNDAGVIGLCAAVFVVQLAVLRRLPSPPSWPLVAALGVLSACAIETKPHAYAMVPGSLILAALLIAAAPRQRRTWLLLLVGVVAYATVRTALPLIIDRPWGRPGVIGLGATPLHDLPSVSLGDFASFLLSIDDGYVDFLFTSAWGSFCWLDVSLPANWFDNLRFAAPLFWLGTAAAVTRRLLAPGDRFFWRLRPYLFSAFTFAMGLLVVLYAEYAARTQLKLANNAIQGRALLFVLPAAAVLGAVAVGSLVPRRFRTLAAASCAFCIVLLGAAGLLIVLRYQYGYN